MTSRYNYSLYRILFFCLFFLLYCYSNPTFCAGFFTGGEFHIPPHVNMPIAPSLSTIEIELIPPTLESTFERVAHSALDVSTITAFTSLSMSSNCWSGTQAVNSAIGLGVGIAAGFLVNKLRYYFLVQKAPISLARQQNRPVNEARPPLPETSGGNSDNGAAPGASPSQHASTSSQTEEPRTESAVPSGSGEASTSGPSPVTPASAENAEAVPSATLIDPTSTPATVIHDYFAGPQNTGLGELGTLKIDVNFHSQDLLSLKDQLLSSSGPSIQGLPEENQLSKGSFGRKAGNFFKWITSEYFERYYPQNF
jgi:hypothetical protein